MAVVGGAVGEQVLRETFSKVPETWSLSETLENEGHPEADGFLGQAEE